MKHLLDYFALKKNLEKSFKESGIDDFSDIDWIMVEVTGEKRSMLPFHGNFSSEETKKIMDAAQKRMNHIPIAYIFGKTNFYGYDFKVDKNVLIPRLDTEILIEEIIKDIKLRSGETSVLDIGTGSGAIAVSIQKETGTKVTAVDISKNALEIAKFNAEQNDAKIEFILSDLFENVKQKFDFIVSNPPYIETETIKSLDKEVVFNEPILALDGGEDGLEFYRKIVADAPRFLNSGGKLYFEIGYNQASSVSELMKKDFKNIKVLKDYGNNDRVVLGEKIWLKN